MAQTEVLGWGTQSAPSSRDISGSHAMEVLVIDATFNGAAAAGSFVPTVKIISDAGEEVGAFPLGSSLAAGDSATVTFGPFLRDTGSGSVSVELGGYDVSTSSASPQPQFTGYDLDSWSFEAGVPLLDITTDPTNVSVLTDGIYTWHFNYRYILRDNAVAPHFPAQGQLRGNFARFVFDLSSVGAPLFSAHEAVLPIEVWIGNGNFIVFPQASNSIRLPMRAGDVLENPFVQHDVAAGDPNARFMSGADAQIIVLREPISGAFPTM